MAITLRLLDRNQCRIQNEIIHYFVIRHSLFGVRYSTLTESKCHLEVATGSMVYFVKSTRRTFPQKVRTVCLRIVANTAEP